MSLQAIHISNCILFMFQIAFYSCFKLHSIHLSNCILKTSLGKAAVTTAVAICWGLYGQFTPLNFAKNLFEMDNTL